MLDLLQHKLYGWWEGFVLMLPNLVVALLILIAAWLVSMAAARAAERVIRRMAHSQTLADLVRRLVRFAVIATGFLVALEILDLSEAAAAFLAGAGIVGLALGFAFQDMTANFIAGVALAVRRPMRVGDLIETNGLLGTVERIHLRSTTIAQPEGPVVHIPNRKIFEEPLINLSTRGQRRVDILVGVSYGDDLRVARQAVIEALGRLDVLASGRAPEVYFQEFGSSSINFVARFWIGATRQTQFLAAQSEGILAIKDAFDAHDLTIPFPIRTLDFGIVGGERLREHLGAPGGGADPQTEAA